jgi:hypothetical protein
MLSKCKKENIAIDIDFSLRAIHYFFLSEQFLFIRIEYDWQRSFQACYQKLFFFWQMFG